MRTPISNTAKLRLPFTTLFALLLLISAAPAKAQDDSNGGDHDKGFDVHLHVGRDGNARTAGLPVYPGARLKRDDEDKDNANFALMAGVLDLKLVVAHYDSDDSPEKVVSYYRDRLKKFGKVVECRTGRSGGDVEMNDDGHDSKSAKELKCDGDNSGSTIELKSGTEANQHVVAVEPAMNGKGSIFALVYLYKRKQGDI